MTVRLEPLQQPSRLAAQKQFCRKLSQLRVVTPAGKLLQLEVGNSPSNRQVSKNRGVKSPLVTRSGLGHFLNILAVYSECFVEIVREYGIRGLIKFIRSTLSGRWLDPVSTCQRLEANFQLRLC